MRAREGRLTRQVQAAEFSTATKNHPQRTAAPGCMRCAHAGLVFGRVRACELHATTSQVERVRQLDARAAGIGLQRDRHGGEFWTYLWPYGPNIDVDARARVLDWAEREQLRMAPLRRRRCLCQLRHGRCVRLHDDEPDVLHWRDHASLWLAGDSPAMLVAQPYRITGDDVEQLDALAEDPELEVNISANSSWYGHGTWFIEVRRSLP